MQIGLLEVAGAFAAALVAGIFATLLASSLGK